MIYQKILGRDISEKTAVEIERICNYIQHPVVFNELPENNPYGFGRADWFAEPNWIVFSITNLPQPFFEANLLHELYHLCQYYEGFPMTQTKVQPRLSPKDQGFLDRIGSASASLVLDLDVCDRIKKFGLSSGYFFDIRYHQVMSFHFDRLTYRDDQVSMILRIAGIILQNDPWQARNVIQHYHSKNKYITQRAQKLASRIKRYDHNSPKGCIKCLTVMYDYLKIWDWQTITFRGAVFPDSQAANTFLGNCGHPDRE